MQDNGLPKAHLAPRIGVSSQYVNLLDTGNFSFKYVVQIEDEPGFPCFEMI